MSDEAVNVSGVAAGGAPAEQQVVYLTGDNATGKTSLGQYMAATHKEWHCVDGDEFVTNDPQLMELLIGASQAATHFMRGAFEDFLLGNSIEGIRTHDTEVRAAFEPFFRALFEKLKQVKETKMVFVYHVWRQWIVDVFREYFPTSTFVEVQVTRGLLVNRYLSRMENKGEKGVSPETAWKEGQGEEIKMLREKYGTEYSGNEEHFKKYVEWRYIFHREPVWEDARNHFHIINNDTFDGAQDLEKVLNRTA